MSSKEWRKEKISKGICGTCGSRPLIPEKKECKECREKRRIRQKKDYQKGEHSKTKKSIKERREFFKLKGLCANCGKNNPSKGLLTCNQCLKIRKDCIKKLKDEVYDHYGGHKCSCCGESIKEFLTLDHIENDGADHRRSLGKGSAGSGHSLYRWIIKNKFPNIFQVMCMNCNWGKRMNNGICPHKTQ
jgi:hypothetical protein